MDHVLIVRCITIWADTGKNWTHLPENTKGHGHLRGQVWVCVLACPGGLATDTLIDRLVPLGLQMDEWADRWAHCRTDMNWNGHL